MTDLLPSRRTILLTAAAFFVLALAAYWSSLTNRFVAWDDTYLIYFNPNLKRITLETLRNIFTTYDPELYIPLTFMSWQADYLVGGLNPLPYHLHSLILHTLSALLVAGIVTRLARHRVAGLVAGLLFLLHPLNVEAVAWASGRKDVLSTFWLLASMALWLAWRERGGRRLYGLSVGAFALSLLAKVSGVTMPVMLVLIDLLERRRMDRAAWMEKIPYVALSVVFGVIGLFGKKDVTAESTLLEKGLMAIKSTGFYLQKLLIPTDLSVIYPQTTPVALSRPDFYVPLLVLLTLLGLTLWSLRRTRAAAFAAAFFLITLAPSFLNLIKAGDIYFASDRYAYVPAIGLFFLAGLGCARLWDMARPQARAGMTAAGAVVALLFLLLTHTQALTWQNSETLFLQTLKTYPGAQAARLNLARVYRESDRIKEAKEQLNLALAIKPHPRVYSNLAAIESREGHKDEALRLYRKGMELDPHDPEPVFGVGIVLAEQKKYAEAEAMYKKAIELKADFTGIYNNFGALYLEQGKTELAEEQFRKALEEDPYYMDAHYNLAGVLAGKGDAAGAAAEYEEVLQIDPDNLDAAILLGPQYLKTKQLDEAIRLARTFLKRKPSNPEAEKLALDMVKGVVAIDSTHAGARALLDEMLATGILKRKST